MQDVSAAFTAEAKSLTRRPRHNFQVSWKKETTLGAITFTIGVSLVGGNDAIGVNPGSIGTPGVYKYFDDTDYVMSLEWERNLNTPIGGISKAMAGAELDNTSGRYTPESMGGHSELFTAILPRRPAIINAGFEVEGVKQTVPQFMGIFDKQPQVELRSKQVNLSMSDYTDFFENKYIDQTLMFTGQRGDQMIEHVLTNNLGLRTADFELDEGIQSIPFFIAPAGTKFNTFINEISQAEMAQFYQDEEGIFRWENRQHWDNAPYNTPSMILMTSDVLDVKTPDESNIINVVEVKANPRAKQPSATIFTMSGTEELSVGDNEIFVNFENPVLAASNPVITAFRNEDGTGTNVTAQIVLKSIDLFAQAAKYIYTNNSGDTAYITSMTIAGRQATLRYPDTGIYYRAQDDSSVTAYEERPLEINNDYIQTETWAQSFANLMLNQYSDPESTLELTIRAKSYIQRGDLISWQGRHWRIVGIKDKLNPSYGYVQELKLIYNTAVTYFRIGISTIGGSDKIAP